MPIPKDTLHPVYHATAAELKEGGDFPSFGPPPSDEHSPSVNFCTDLSGQIQKGVLLDQRGRREPIALAASLRDGGVPCVIASIVKLKSSVEISSSCFFLSLRVCIKVRSIGEWMIRYRTRFIAPVVSLRARWSTRPRVGTVSGNGGGRGANMKKQEGRGHGGRLPLTACTHFPLSTFRFSLAHFLSICATRRLSRRASSPFPSIKE